ncbi:hypothetical protein YPPY09_0960, partial [Yersinia pestis PY-09]
MAYSGSRSPRKAGTP